MQQPPQPLAPGDPATVGSWSLLGRLGAGGMGTVYLARGADGAMAAVKVVRADLAGDPGFVARFRIEVAAARRVAAFCTARVVDAGPDDSPPWLATEYVPGPSLDQAVRRSGPLDQASLEGLAVGMASALTSIHAAGLVHRDLKPANVLLAPFGPRVIDFGIARALDQASSAMTEAGMLIGTPGWMAPEQLTGAPVTPAADVFAWGGLVAFAGTGRPPFGTGPPEALGYRVVHGRPDLAGLPAKLASVVASAMAPDPAARPTARQLLLELTGSQAGADPAAVTEHLRGIWVVPGSQQATQVLGPPAARRRRSRLVPALLGALALATAGILAVVLLPDRGGGSLAGAPTTTRRQATATTEGPATTRPAPVTTGRAPAEGRVGDPVADGELRFVVASMRCDRRTLGDGLPARASGRFCLARVEVTNTGTAAQTMIGADQVLIDGGGRRWRIDARAMLEVPEPLLVESIPAGATINGTLVWDLPKQRKPAAVELHASGFTEGATVSL